MGELINLRRVKKAAEHAAKEKTTAVKRIAYGTPKHLRKIAKTEKRHADQRIEAHKLDPTEPRS